MRFSNSGRSFFSVLTAIGISLSLFLLIGSGCVSVNSTLYSYSDGNGNMFIVSGGKQKTLEYLPIKASDSSSGVYSGGEPVKKVISESAYVEIAESLDAGVADTATQINNRTLGSGLIEVEQNGAVKNYILAPESASLLRIETILRDTLK